MKPVTPLRPPNVSTWRTQAAGSEKGRQSMEYMRPPASGSTFLYMGAFGGVQPQRVGESLGRYVVRGVVHDENGGPVEGAAVDLGGEMAFTNSQGEFSNLLLKLNPHKRFLPGNKPSSII